MIGKLTSVAVATALIGAVAIVTPTPAEAHGGVGVGIAAGLLGGAILGGVIANSQPRSYTYVETPVYEDDTVVCHRVLFRDEYGNRYWRRVCN